MLSFFADCRGTQKSLRHARIINEGASTQQVRWNLVQAHHPTSECFGPELSLRLLRVALQCACYYQSPQQALGPPPKQTHSLLQGHMSNHISEINTLSTSIHSDQVLPTNEFEPNGNLTFRGFV